MKALKSYLWQQWVACNHPKYYRYFEMWFANLTDYQIEYFLSYSAGKKTIVNNQYSV